MINRCKDMQGITLVVLVITIIVLLILAGVAIINIVGENGILIKTLTAKQIYETAQQDEKNALDDAYGSMLIGSNDNAEITITLKELKELIREEVQNTSNIPVGSLISYMGNNVPEGYLLCDGQIYNISEYSALAEQIKSEFGSYNYYGGDGVTTFATPDLKGKFLKGSNQAGISEQAGLPNIIGELVDVLSQTASGALQKGTGTYKVNVGTSMDSIATFGTLTLDASKSNSIYGTSTTVTPENMSVLYCIKY